MSMSDLDFTKSTMNKSAIDFSNKYNVNVSSLSIYPPISDCFIQISPDNNLLAFFQNNELQIFQKEEGQWKNKTHRIISLEKRKVKGINWSPDNKMILVYGDNNKENKALIKVVSLNSKSWECEIGFGGSLSHASFYPDSLNIVYIKSVINILNIFSLLKYSDISKKNIDKMKYEYLFLKFDDERSINYIENNHNIFMILPCYGRSLSEKKTNYPYVDPSDYIIILVNKKVYKCFKPVTVDLDRIIPLNNKYPYFIVVEKEFYKYPFYIHKLNGEIIFKSEFPKLSEPKRLTNPCLLCNKNKETNFIVVQAKGGRLEIFGCQNIFSRSNICYFYDYTQINDYIEKNKKSKSMINYGNRSQRLNIFNEKTNNIVDENFVDINNILFLEEQIINNNDNDNSKISIENNGMSKDDINLKKNRMKRVLIKVNPFNVEPCFDENDYLLYSEISPVQNYICFINKKYPKYLFFGNYYQSGVFKIIKFMNDVINFKWSTEQDILLVTLDSSFIYLITKDYYLNYNLEENYNFDNIVWSHSGKEVILSNEEKNIRMVAILE
jgi:hypothetical protein